MKELTEFKKEVVLNNAKQMCLAALTAPKARGTDNLVIKVAEGEDIERLSAKLEELYQTTGQEFLHRDSQNILQSQAIVLIGSRIQPLGLNCGYCGYPNCGTKPQDVPCFFNSNDLGIAVGSACSTAADLKTDNRVMFSVGLAAKESGLMPDCPIVLAIVLSASGKSVFFDRK
ncbi:MAG: DUF2148 domain-containing protein [Bacteroidales bacterium]|nr:ferredoxin [Bacteroidales bacterium]MBQ2387195.1 ferredoxin [Bacteroidales bacterium]MEE0926120.1 DUF2148 domain-containing protein [Bacteroidales bacterium]MEE0936593.1 DUF2148 domain-containing protein [Bacteroidales bacterium]